LLCVKPARKFWLSRGLQAAALQIGQDFMDQHKTDALVSASTQSVSAESEEEL
jgi:hypothetical protein